MPALLIVRMGHLLLRQKALELLPEKIKDKAFQTFLDAMMETMQRAEGVGLAANQVAEPFSALVLACKANARYPGQEQVLPAAYMNIRILEYSAEMETDWEGCLSIPGYRGLVPRSKEVTFEALDRHGKNERKTVRGFHARIIQHEADHLNGMFYVDRMPDLKSWMHLKEFNDQFNQGIEEED